MNCAPCLRPWVAFGLTAKLLDKGATEEFQIWKLAAEEGASISSRKSGEASGTGLQRIILMVATSLCARYLTRAARASVPLPGASSDVLSCRGVDMEESAAANGPQSHQRLELYRCSASSGERVTSFALVANQQQSPDPLNRTSACQLLCPF